MRCNRVMLRGIPALGFPVPRFPGLQGLRMARSLFPTDPNYSEAGNRETGKLGNWETHDLAAVYLCGAITIVIRLP